MVKLDGFGTASVKKLLEAINTSKDTTLDRFIYALSIPLIGRSASKTISKYFDGDFERFYKECVIQDFDFRTLNDFGDSMNDSINNYLDENYFMIGILSRYMYFEKPQISSNGTSLDGLTFVITGSLNHFANRDEAKEKIESLGGKVSGSVSAKTSYLVNNDVNSTSGKNKKAKELNVPIINEDELIKMLN
jgi:DNA ligase (NAD+)